MNEFFFRYLNFISDLNSNEKQKYLNLRASTRDLERQIFEEELNFIKHYEEIYDYLDNIGYLDKRTEYKNAAIYLKISIPSSFLLHNNQLRSFENRNLIFNQIKRNYTIFINLDPDGSKLFDKTLKENFRNYRKDISPFLEDTINKIQKTLDECK
ncbi:hypothetical protein ACNGFT_08160 [Campylobacter jejuni]